MAALTIQEAAEGLASVTFGAAAAGDTIAGGARGAGWDLSVQLWIRNTDVATRTITVAGHPAVICPASTGTSVVPVYGQPYGAAKLITYSSTVGLTVAAVRVAPPK